MAETLSFEDKMQLQKWIGNGSKTSDLLFSIKKDGCDSETFHKLCDSKGPTVTVLNNRGNSVFGGYTSVAWKSFGSYREDNNAFMFQLRHNGEAKINKFPHRDGKKAIYDHKDYGPTFGSGYDLLTFVKRVKKEDEYFPLNGKMKSSTYDMSECAKGKINNDDMHVKDLEVYLVKDVPVTKWRKAETYWDEMALKSLKDDVRNFSYPADLEVTQANILLLGPVGAGKSSFINTIYSIFVGYYVAVASSGSATDSLTTKVNLSPL